MNGPMIENLHITALEKILGPQGIIVDPHDIVPYMHEWRGRMKGQSRAVLRPRNTDEVAALVHYCATHHIPLVPQGGNTGLVGASVPPEDGSALLISLKRMNNIRKMDAADFSMVAEAGCILADVQKAADNAGRYFAMTLASEGSATIGGLVATNAGGSLTLRYGNMREQVLGLEAVMPNGQIWHGLKSLRKNNTGYDIKQLLIGSEGTLGIITAATLKLMPRPAHKETAFLAFETPQQALEALALLRHFTEDRLAVYELLPGLAIETAARFISGVQNPFTTTYPWAALIETHTLGDDAPATLANSLEKILARGVIIDATLASSSAQARQFWHLREAVVEAQKHLGASLKHDLSVPISQMPVLIIEGKKLAQNIIPDCRLYAFGHVGDGNIHFNISPPEGMDNAGFIAQQETMARTLHDLAIHLGGSISAEHGIGRFKREEFHRTTSSLDLALLQHIKTALDPYIIMNKGVLV